MRTTQYPKDLDILQRSEYKNLENNPVYVSCPVVILNFIFLDSLVYMTTDMQENLIQVQNLNNEKVKGKKEEIVMNVVYLLQIL